MWGKAYPHRLLSSGLKPCSLCKAARVEIQKLGVSAETWGRLSTRPSTLPSLPKLIPFGSAFSRNQVLSPDMSIAGPQMTTTRWIHNLGIVGQIILCSALLDAHHRTCETFPVCSKCSYSCVSLTIHLFLKASFCSKGETKAWQLKCFLCFTTLLHTLAD